MKVDEVVDNVKKLAPFALKFAPYEVFTNYNVFSDIRNVSSKYSKTITNKETIDTINNSIKNSGLDATIANMLKKFKENDEDEATGKFRSFLYWLYNSILNNTIKAADENTKNKWLTYIKDCTKKYNFDMNVFDEISKSVSN